MPQIEFVHIIKFMPEVIELEIVLDGQRTRVHVFHIVEFMDIPERYLGDLAFAITRTAIRQRLTEDAGVLCDGCVRKLIRQEIVQMLVRYL